MNPFLISIAIFFSIIGLISWFWIKEIIKVSSYPPKEASHFGDLSVIYFLAKNAEKKALKRRNILLLIFAAISPVIAISSFLFGLENMDSRICRYYNEFIQKEVKGVVVEKYIDYDNHASETLVLNSYGRKVKGTEVGSYAPESFTFVEVGDSVIKPKNSTIIWIKNEGKNRQFNFYKASCDDGLKK